MIHELSSKEKKARELVCLPLDGLDSLQDIEERVKELSPYVGMFKIGKESFTRFGLDVIEIVKLYGAKMFLDLKYNDIPNTVFGASEAATEHEIYVFNVHANGGREQIRKAVQAAQHTSNLHSIERPKVIFVTVLTSIGPAEYLDVNLPLVPKLSVDDLKPYYGMKTDDVQLQYKFALMLEEKGYRHLIMQTQDGLRSNVIEQEVLNLAKMVANEGGDGIVCSAADLSAITEHLPDDFMYITPGIKGPNTPAGDDQKRVATPSNAIRDGSNMLVIGRAITGGNTPEERQQAAYEVLQDIAKVL